MKFFKEQKEGMSANYDSESARASSRAFLNEDGDKNSNTSLTRMKDIAELEKEEENLRNKIGIQDEKAMKTLELHKDDIEDVDWKEIVNQYFHIRKELVDARKELNEFLEKADRINN